jgi:glycosyltransferase involved in cell wall biosynthesis
MSAALYVCYFGLREPLVQTQVLPYLRELAKGGHRMSLLTFEPRRWSADEATEQRVRLRAEGIAWHMLPYHKRPSLPATLYDIVRGAFHAASIGRAEGIEIFHGRSHVGAAIGALAKAMNGGKLIFDFRGFLAEEYVDSGNWRAGGVLYRLTKAAERWLIRRSDAIVVLTENARQALATARPMEVIPTCVDVDRFAHATRADLGLGGRVVFVYAGSLGGYYLTRETAELLEVARARDPRTFALVLTHSASEAISKELESRGFTRDDYHVIRVAPEEMPAYLAAADVGVAVIEPSFARRAMSPTKFAEYLAAGLPVIASAGIGDLDQHIEEGRVGALLRRHDRAAYAEALGAIEELRRDPALAERCRGVARARYDLVSVGGMRYQRLYAEVCGTGSQPVRGREAATFGGGRVENPSHIHILALASYPIEAASSRFRIAQFIAPLAERGIDVTFSPFLDAPLFAALYKPGKLLTRLPRLALRTLLRLTTLARRADVVFVQREAMLFGPALVEWFLTRIRHRPLLLDLDDATWIAYSSPIYGRLATLLKVPRKTDRLIRWARVVTCGSPNIASYVAARGAEAVVIPTVADTRLFHPRTAPPPEVPVVGWIGTHGTYPFLERLLPLFERLRREMPFELTIIGSGRAIDTRAWQLEREADDFRALDVGVYPIGTDAWSEAKSGFKAVQYMASGVPFVMSPVGVCAAMGIPGETHLLASTDEEWLAALRRLIADPALRARMGGAGRAFAERHYSIDAQADTLAAAIRRASS